MPYLFSLKKVGLRMVGAARSTFVASKKRLLSLATLPLHFVWTIMLRPAKQYRCDRCDKMFTGSSGYLDTYRSQHPVTGQAQRICSRCVEAR